MDCEFMGLFFVKASFHFEYFTVSDASNINSQTEEQKVHLELRGYITHVKALTG